MKREVKGTMWVLVTLVTVVIMTCAVICVIGLTTYEITSRTH